MFRFGQKISTRLARHLSSATAPARHCGPMVSFTFDDAPISAATRGAEILEDFDVRGTYYLNGALLGGHGDVLPILSPAQARQLAQNRHEIGCHTFNHLNVQNYDGSTLETDLDKNRRCLADLTGITPTNFAYPFGRVSYAAKQRLQKRFVSCRSIFPGVNEGRIDLAMLRAVSIYDCEVTSADVARWLAVTVERAGWLIFYTHDIQTDPSVYGTTPRFFREIVKMSTDAGCACLSVERALNWILRPSREPTLQDAKAAAAMSLMDYARNPAFLSPSGPVDSAPRSLG